MPSTHRRRATALATLAATLALLVPAAPAHAHNRLVGSTPADGARLDTPPREVVLTFVERLDPRYTQIVVTDAGRQPVPAAPPAVTDTTGSLTLDGRLPDGTYTVAYRVVSVDGHPVQGAVTFTVGDATPPPAPGTPAAAPRRPTALIAAGAAALAVAVAAGGAVLLRRRRVPAR